MHSTYTSLRLSVFLGATFLLYFVFLAESRAFTGEELMKVFSSKDRVNYVTGLIHMASYQAILDKDETRANCIIDWFHTPDLAAMTQIEQVFERYDDKHAEPLILVLINRECGKRGKE